MAKIKFNSLVKFKNGEELTVEVKGSSRSNAFFATLDKVQDMGEVASVKVNTILELYREQEAAAQ